MRRHLFLLSVLLMIFGCSGVKSDIDPRLKQVFEAKAEVSATDRDYRLHLGDLLDIKFFYNPELNETVKIRPDGKIALQLIEEVRAEGLTPAEFTRTLADKYSKVLRQPEVTVIIREFSANKVYVGGEVKSPGIVNIEGRMTSLQAILLAGGFKDTATLTNVLILRDSGTDKPEFFTVNLKEDLTTRSSKNDSVLKPYDIVFVPKSTIAEMDQFVDQYFVKLIPVNLGFGFNYVYNLRPEVQVK